MAAAAAVQQPVSAQVVGNAFVQQYYHIQHQSPALVHRFYQDISKVGRPADDGSMTFTTTLPAINEVILSLNYGEYRAEIKSVDSQESFNGGVHVLVTGYMAGKDNIVRNFAQTFFLAPQEKGFFVLNDIFRYMDVKQQLDNPAPASDVDVAPLTPEQADSTPIPETNVPEQSVVPVEANGEEDQNPSDNEEEVPVAEVVDEVPEEPEPVPVPEVVDEVPDDSQKVSESNAKIEEVPKKSYASIVMVMKENPMPVSSPPPPPRRSAIKSQEQAKVAPVSSTVDTHASDSDALDNGNNQEDEADGFSIYIKGLPLNATPALLENEFKKYGPIKSDGIQVRSNKQGFCFGFVEFEELPAVQKAMEASPISLGGRQVFIEEKRSTNSRVNSRGRFPAGRGGAGFRNDGGRGRGNFGNGGGRGYPRGEFGGGRSDFGNNRGGGSRTGGYANNRGSDSGYQRGPDSNGTNGGRTNRGGGVAVNGATRNVAPRVSATA